MAIDTHHPVEASPQAISSAHPSAAARRQLEGADLGGRAGAHQPRAAKLGEHLGRELAAPLGVGGELSGHRGQPAYGGLEFARDGGCGGRLLSDHDRDVSGRHGGRRAARYSRGVGNDVLGV